MSHFVQGPIALQACFKAWRAPAPHRRTAALAQGFGLLLPADDGEHLEDGAIAARIIAAAQQLALAAPVAFIASEHCGGAGGQRAASSSSGGMVSSHAENASTAPASTALRDPAINCVLRALAVAIGQHCEEFAVIGLTRWRSHQAWLASIDDSVADNG